MSAQASDLTGGMYYICRECKEAKFSSGLDTLLDAEPINEWIMHHTNAGHQVDLEFATKFLSEDLANGFIDVDREGLEPIILTIPGGDEKPKDGLIPGGSVAALALQKRMRIEAMHKQPGEITKITATPEQAETIKQDIAKLDPHAKFETRRDPSLKDMQVTLPWTVHYSRDYRSNPESHKDFRHAVTHAMKAIGKLNIIIDDYDHKRSSQYDAKAKDWLADLVICALRAANKYPGGVIDLMAAVQERVYTKNFGMKKEVELDGPE